MTCRSHSRHQSGCGKCAHPVRVALIIILSIGFVVTASSVIYAQRKARSPIRQWTHRDGRQTVDAALEAYAPGRVWLRRDDGRLFEIPLDTLSKEDQEYVAEVEKRDLASIKLAEGDDPLAVPYAPGRLVARLHSRNVDESSGIAASIRFPGWFYTHNDSGNDSRLYRFDAAGREGGVFPLENVIAYDWEDIASFRRNGKPYILVADSGNNGLASEIQILHVVEEPDIAPPVDERSAVALEHTLPVVLTIYYRYEDDFHDCEAVAVDSTDGTILLIAKEHGIGCNAYALPWPKEVKGNEVLPAVTARKIAELALPEVTALDVSSDGHRAVVGTYGDAYEFTRHEGETWKEAFARPPRRIVLPQRRQGEALCYGSDGKTLYATSEGYPAPLFEIPPAKNSTDEHR
ncbi:hypothetical protein JCM19992_31060 [Thermostilla marina]